jgi:hypothetical protein
MSGNANWKLAWLDRKRFGISAVSGGTAIFLAVLAASLAFGPLFRSLMGVLNWPVLVGMVMLPTLVLLMAALRWAAEKVRRNTLTDEERCTALTIVRLHFVLAHGTAMLALAVLALLTAVLSLPIRHVALDALLFVILVPVLVVIFPLHALDNGMLALRALHRGTARG